MRGGAAVGALLLALGLACTPKPVPPPVRPDAADAAAQHGCMDACDHLATQLRCDMDVAGCRAICERLTVNQPGYPDCLFAAPNCAATDACAR